MQLQPERLNKRMNEILNCNDKMRFLTREAANISIDFMSADRSHKKPPPLAAYQCGICGGWHKTSKLDRRQS